MEREQIEQQQYRLNNIVQRYEQAKSRRSNWESHWQECYDYALPERGNFTHFDVPGARKTQNLYDGTAMDSVDQLAASLLGNLTPPWTGWFGFKPGPELNKQEAQDIAPLLEDIGKTIQAHLDRSNFNVEMHQCFLDLAVGGTATLFFEETEPGAFSAFKFTSVPLHDVILEEGDKGFLDNAFRVMSLTLAQIEEKYPAAQLPERIYREGTQDSQARFKMLESVLPEKGVYAFTAILLEETAPVLLSEGVFNESPAISFRWMKSSGEVYGRSPIMKALPDIKTVNKVVELILKNASIAVTGIWQADDDGVLNPANIELKPGAIIPKAVGSQGLKALEMPGRFDVSELILNDLRGRIRHALLTDKLGPVSGGRMTATEIIERSSEMALLLGATYGRLQSELLTPLIQRAFSILKRRGEIPDIELDGRYVALDYRSPLARIQGQKNVQNILLWLDSLSTMGAGAASSVNIPNTVKHLAQALGVPNDLIQKELTLTDIIPDEIISEEVLLNEITEGNDVLPQ